MDHSGRPWAPVDPKARPSRLCRKLWTLTDTAWSSTDQKVGDSSSSGRADKPNGVHGPSLDTISRPV
jgi:hypothetical protein